ncbi:amidohydrolase family protein [Parvularcula marina]|nr:amidohydrolase family protein [Parvularcula marina]
MKKLISTLAFGMAALTGVATAQTYAITNGHLMMTGDAADPGEIVNGTVIIRDGVIVAAGRNVTIPDNAEVYDAGGAPVTPGLFSPISGLALEEIELADDANDRRVGGFPLSASLKAADAINPDSTVIPVSRSAGVTRAHVGLLAGGDTQFGGCGALIVLDGSMDPLIKECAAQTALLGYSGARRAGDNRAASIAMFRRALTDARNYARDPYLYNQRWTEGHLPAEDADALGDVLSGDVPIIISAFSAPDIRRTLDLADEFGFDLILYGAVEAWRVADEIAAADVPVIIDPMTNLPYLWEDMGATLANAARLEEAGVDVAFANGETHNIRLMPQMAGNAVANGMSHLGALAAITAVPARIFGVEDQLGTLAPGKAADVVVWTGDPLELSSRPRVIFIDGKPQSLDSRQSALVKRYRNLERRDLPTQYYGQ